jgi:WD40 repeat protein
MAWSPNSQRLAWLAADCTPGLFDAHSVWITNADGTESHTIYEESQADDLDTWGPIAWSPDGASVAVLSLRGDAYLIDANCSNRANGCDPSSRTMTSDVPVEWQHSYYPQWGGTFPGVAPSPMATVMNTPLPFAPTGALESCGNDLCLVDNQGEHRPMGFSDRYTIIISPSWSPDGSRFVFSACPLEIYNNGDCWGSLIIASRDGREVTPLVRDPTANNGYPAWSPDGEWIAYIPNGALLLVRPDGSELRTLLSMSDDVWAEGLAWTPDSQRIAWVGGDCRHCRNDGGNPVDGVWVMNRDGTQMQETYRSFPIGLRGVPMGIQLPSRRSSVQIF